MSHTPNIKQALLDHWGFGDFRPGQQEVIEAVLQNKDSFVLFPTGGGKSLCYQLPAILRDGVCIVISPLIALMQDQVEQLKTRQIKADFIHAGMSYYEVDRLLDNAIYGDTKLLYLAPERLKLPLTLERMRQMNINLIAVDEAHCISQWGHDFRPAYRELGEIRQEFRQTPFMALTATATPRVVQDITDQLHLHDPVVVQKSFARDNLHLVVRKEEDKVNQIVHVLEHVEGSAIVYVRSRKKTMDLAKLLNERGIRASGYHAGMAHDVRSHIMNAWMRNQIRVVCSTNAFGMGVDKADVRIVMHIDLPPSLEEYYQEAGRAGRDGNKSYCILFHNDADRLQMQNRFKLAFPELDEIKRIYALLGQYYHLATGSGEGENFEFDLQLFAEKYGLGYQATTQILKILEQSGWIALTDSFYEPSKVMMVADKRMIYDYQLRHKSAATFIKVMLRTYEGLYSHYTRISESFLANTLMTSEAIVNQMLEQLQADEIIDYEPASDSAKLTFLLPRSSNANFAIDRVQFNQSRQRMIDRLTAVLQYVDAEDCRMNELLEYFDEKHEEPCGRCDNCLEKDRPPDEKTYVRFRAIVLKNLSTSNSIKSILSLFPSNRKKQVLHILNRMVEESWVTVENDDVALHPSKQSKE